MTRETNSRIPGFYKRPVLERQALLHEAHGLSAEAASFLHAGGGLDVELADRMSENVIAVSGLPLSVALNFRVNNRDVLVPMAVEEPSIVAAASNAARLVRIGGGFVGEADEPVMTTQIQLDGVPNPLDAAARILDAKAELIRAADAAIPRMVARGGGAKDIDVRVLDETDGVVVVHIYVDVRDAMGANLVDTVAEAVAPRIAAITGGQVGLRILSNLPLRRCARVRAKVSEDVIGGAELADGIAAASRFAELDPFRAVTHNKGIMNGIDAVAVALGQDWRSIEAAAHGFAAHRGTYGPLATWRRDAGGLVGDIELPLPVGTVGGSTRNHPGVRAAFELVAVKDARELAVVMAAAGLASNLAALKALAGEGIQKGHMRLHQRKEAFEHAAMTDSGGS